MLSKHLTSKLKEEQEREAQNNPNQLSASQCDRIIRTVSCKVCKEDLFSLLDSYKNSYFISHFQLIYYL